MALSLSVVTCVKVVNKYNLQSKHNKTHNFAVRHNRHYCVKMYFYLLLFLKANIDTIVFVCFFVIICCTAVLNYIFS